MSLARGQRYIHGGGMHPKMGGNNVQAVYDCHCQHDLNPKHLQNDFWSVNEMLEILLCPISGLRYCQ